MKSRTRTVGIIGSRRRDTATAYRKVADAFLALHRKIRATAIVSGGCERGADRLAPLLARKFGLMLIIYFPDYSQYGRIAPLVRNGHVAREAHWLIAAVHPSRTGGTEDTIQKFLRSRPKRCLILV